jgi:hypothetical protein
MNTKATSEMLFEYHERVEALEADNARLRAALERIAAKRDPVFMAQVAKFALGREE